MKCLKASIWVLAACCLMGQITFAQNVVTDWAGIVQPAILTTDAGTPRPPASSQVLRHGDQRRLSVLWSTHCRCA